MTPTQSHDRAVAAEAGSVTRLITGASVGDPLATEQLFRRVYAELHRLAAARMNLEGRSPADGEATDLVHEAFARLPESAFLDRKHLFLSYAVVMRNILVDRARRRRAPRRGGGVRHEGGDAVELLPASGEVGMDPVECAELLGALREAGGDDLAVFELRFFGGLSYRDAAEVLGMTEYGVREAWGRSVERLRALTGERD